MTFWGGECPFFSVKVSVQRFFGDVPSIFLGRNFLGADLFFRSYFGRGFFSGIFCRTCFSKIRLVDIFLRIFLGRCFQNSFGRNCSSELFGRDVF